MSIYFERDPERESLTPDELELSRHIRKHKKAVREGIDRIRSEAWEERKKRKIPRPKPMDLGVLKYLPRTEFIGSSFCAIVVIGLAIFPAVVLALLVYVTLWIWNQNRIDASIDKNEIKEIETQEKKLFEEIEKIEKDAIDNFISTYKAINKDVRIDGEEVYCPECERIRTAIAESGFTLNPGDTSGKTRLILLDPIVDEFYYCRLCDYEGD